MYSRILVAVDGSAPSKAALQEAIRIARGLHSTLHLVHVIDVAALATSFGTSGSEYYAHFMSELQSYGADLLREYAATVRAAGVNVEAEIPGHWGGSVGEGVLRAAEGFRPDLIVCGTHGRRGLSHVLLGSDAEYILRHAQVPVLLVRVPEKTG